MTGQPENIDGVLRGFARGLKSKTGIEDVGGSLAALGSLFAMPDLMITDVEAAHMEGSQAVMYSARSLPELRAFIGHRPLAAHPVFSRSWQGDAPFFLSDVRHELSLSEAELWAIMPPWAHGNEALSVNVHATPGRRLNFSYAGRGADTSGVSRSTLFVASTMAAEHLADLERGPKSPLLTKREAEVLRLIAAGKSDDEISGELDIAARTVRFHLENAKQKLGVSTRAQAVLMVLRDELA